MNEIKKYSYWLMSTPVLTDGQRLKLFEYFGSSQEVFFAREQDLIESNILKKDSIESLVRARDIYNLEESYISFTSSPFDFVTLEDDYYPNSLKYIHNIPYGLFFAGDMKKILGKKCVALVGARSCSAYGKRMAEELANELAKNDIVVISGLAKGIDSYAHTGSLKAGGITAAVLGCGVDIIYPKENAVLYEQIAKTGCVISEYAMGTSPQPRLFPLRNRIISGLCQTTVVVEARLKSGSLITADYALEQGKDIYVIPGRVGDSLSAGCNKLASQGAGIIFSIDQFLSDILELNSENRYSVITDNHAASKIELNSEQLLVYGLFDLYPKSLAQVQADANMDALKLVAITMELCHLGLLKEVFKNNYIINGVC
ncbi:MAG: DNA-protecting protein DprA [Pseudobutyrivibrio sp.]|nr:DNA-protecting protein DprA [Pseudobutyrivibrio sp.]